MYIILLRRKKKCHILYKEKNRFSLKETIFRQNTIYLSFLLKNVGISKSSKSY